MATETLSDIDQGRIPPNVRTGLPGAGDNWSSADREYFERELAGIEETVLEEVPAEVSGETSVHGVRGYAFNARAGAKVLGILGAPGVKSDAAAGGMPDYLRTPPVAKHLGVFAVYQMPTNRNERPHYY